MGAPRIHVVLADDHPVIVDGLTTAFADYPTIEVVGIARQFAEVFPTLTQHPTDVIVLDIGNMGGGSLTAVYRLRREHPDVKVVIFSSSVDLAPELFAAGAHGYVLKEELASELVRAIQVVHQGRGYESPLVAHYLRRRAAYGGDARLTPQERVVLKLLAQGLRTTSIAEMLNIRARCVQNHISSMLEKTGAEDRVQLVAWYHRLSES